MIILYKTNHFGQFAHFARNGSACMNCRKLDTVRASFRMCKTHMTHGTFNVYDSNGKLIGEKSECDVITVEWVPPVREHSVSYQFERGRILQTEAELAWIFKNPKSFAEECAAPNVTEADVNAGLDIIMYVLESLERGIPADLEEIGSMAERLEESFKADDKRRRFVDEVKYWAIMIKAAPVESQDEVVKELLSNLGFWCGAWVFKELDAAMVKQGVISIDPQSKGGRGKKGPPWLAARLIVMANAGDEFDLPRPTETDDEYFDYVLQALQNACRPGRGKPK